MSKIQKGKPEFQNTIITIDGASLKFLKEGTMSYMEDGAAYVGFHVDELEVESKSITGISGTSVEGTWSANGVDRGEVENDGDYAVKLIIERLQEAVKNGGILTVDFVFNWTVKGSDKKTIGTFEQKVTVKVDVTKLTLVDTREGSETINREIWNATEAELYKLKNPVQATETEENKTTEGNKKDDVPKTGEVILIMEIFGR